MMLGLGQDSFTKSRWLLSQSTLIHAQVSFPFMEMIFGVRTSNRAMPTPQRSQASPS